MVEEWVPQNDILGHPKLKLFITHGGNNGQYEALYHGNIELYVVTVVTISIFIQGLLVTVSIHFIRNQISRNSAAKTSEFY